MKSNAIKASSWFAITNIVRKAITILTVPIFTRILTTSEYGYFTLYCSWSEIITLFITLNLASNMYHNAVIKKSKEIRNLTSSWCGLIFILGILFTIFSILFQNQVRFITGLPFKYILLMIVDCVFSPAYSFWMIRERFQYRYKAIVTFTILQAIINPFLGILLISNMEDNSYARCLSIVMCNMIFYLPAFYYTFKKCKKFFSMHHWKYALILAVPLIPHYLSQILLNQMDRIMISKIDGEAAAGIYGLAYSIALGLLIVNRAINDTFTPWMYQKLKNHSYANTKKIQLYLLLFIGILNIMIILLAPEAIKIMSPSTYYEAVWIIPPVSISAYFTFLYSLFCNIEFYYEAGKKMTIVSTMGALLNFVLNIIFIPIYGFIAAGYTTLICYIFFAFAHYYTVKKIIGMEIYMIFPIKGMLIISICITCLGLILQILYTYTIFRYIMIIFVCMCLFKLISVFKKYV